MTKNIFKDTKIFKFAISGFLAYSVELLIFKFILEEFRVWYIVASSIALILSFFVSFSLQKFWTFKHKETVYMKGEVLMYLGVVILNLFLNAAVFYLFVEFFNLPSLLGRFLDFGILKSFFHRKSYGLVLTQATTAFLVGLWNFWFYKKIIFRDHKMRVNRLLFITQKIDDKDSVLGFVEGWVEKLSKRFESIKVICLYRGQFNLPENIDVFSLGKEAGVSKLKNLKNFYRLIFNLRKEYDAVFVHMNEEYVLLGGIFWILFRKKIFMWRNHYSGSWKTSLAAWFCNKVFYTSKFSYTARYKKSLQMPVGVDDDFFVPNNKITFLENCVLSLGRLDESKNIHILLEALSILKERGALFSATIVGDPSDQSSKYPDYLKELVVKYNINDRVVFVPGVAKRETVNFYQNNEFFVNLSRDGMFDKTIFEAMACGLLVVASSSDFAKIVDDRFVFPAGDARVLADKLEFLFKTSPEERKRIKNDFIEIVRNNHSLKILLDSLAKNIQQNGL